MCGCNKAPRPTAQITWTITYPDGTEEVTGSQGKVRIAKSKGATAVRTDTGQAA